MVLSLFGCCPFWCGGRDMIPFVMLPLEFVKDLNIFCLYPRECKIFERFPISCAFVSIVLMINICISLLICLYFVSDVCLFLIF